MLSERDTLTTAMQTSGATSTRKQNAKTAIAAVEDVLKAVTDSLEDSKAEELVTIDIKDKSALADYMVIASGRSNRHVSAIADHLLRELKTRGMGSSKVEGLDSADWVLIDTGDVIVHLFRPEVREFYALEKMWQMPASEEVN
ncbi:MAG: ribosome silencing factor [Rhizobiaceae bacterium]|nr:ribosome silencing factor [Rhizobiaceae bacterium]